MKKTRVLFSVRRHLAIVALSLFSGHAAKDSEKTAPEASLQLGHMQTVTAIAIAKSQNVLASGGEIREVLLWDLKSGRQLRSLSGHSGPITSLAFSHGGDLLASSDSDGTVKVWDPSTGAQRYSLKICSTLINALVFDPVRARIMAACSANSIGSAPSQSEIAVWNIESNSVRRLACQKDCTAIAFTKDGAMAALGMKNGAVEIWKANAWEKLAEVPDSGGEVKNLAFSDDTSRLLLRTSQRLREWDRVRHEFTEDYQLRTIASSYLKDGSIFAAIVSTGGIIQFAKLHRGERRDLWSWKEEFSLKTLILDAESNLGAAGGSFQSRGTVAVWNLQTGSLLTRLVGHVLSSRASRIAGDNLISATEEGTVHLWDLSGREADRSTRHAGNIPTITTSRTGNLVATADISGLVNLWGVTSEMKLQFMKSYNTSSFAAALSEKGDWLAIGQAEHENVVRVIHLLDDHELTLSDNQKFVSVLAFNSLATKLASGSYDGSVMIWDALKGWAPRRIAGHSEWVLALAFSNVSDFLLTGARDHFVKLWDSSTGGLKQSWKVPEEVSSVGFSPDGKIAAAASGGKVYLWNALTGKSIDVASTEGEFVAGLTFREDGTALYGVSSDGPLIAWRVFTNRLHEVGRLLPEQSGSSTSISSNGQFDSTNLEDIRGFSWVFPGAPFRTLAPEVFMRDYYEPRLIARLMSGEKFKEVRSLDSLNRAQPEVGKPEIVPEPGTERLVTVRVHVRSTTSDTERDAAGKPRRSGVYDLRLFRDGQMIGQWPLIIAPEPMVGPDGSDVERSAWKKRHVIVDSHADVTDATVEIPHVKLPRRADQKEVDFSAYAFNEDRVKSTTASNSLPLPADFKRRMGKAYIISVGVNRTRSTPAWDLSYAVNDARELSRVVSRKLRKTKQFADVVPVCLISDDAKAVVKQEDRCDSELPATRNSLQELCWTSSQVDQSENRSELNWVRLWSRHSQRIWC